jgi:hypothetical protein
MTAKPTPKPRTRSPEHAAASLCVELAALDTADAKAKDAMQERAAKRKGLLEGASPEVLKFVDAMRRAVSK